MGGRISLGNYGERGGKAFSSEYTEFTSASSKHFQYMRLKLRKKSELQIQIFELMDM